MTAEIGDSAGEQAAPSVSCVMEGARWIVHDGEQFVQ